MTKTRQAPKLPKNDAFKNTFILREQEKQTPKYADPLHKMIRT